LIFGLLAKAVCHRQEKTKEFKVAIQRKNRFPSGRHFVDELAVELSSSFI
jgi:hypothetical protein